MARRHFLEAINAFVDVRQREQVQQNIDGGKHPKKEPISKEIASQCGNVQPSVAADIVCTAGCIEQCYLGEEVHERHKDNERQQGSLKQEFLCLEKGVFTIDRSRKRTHTYPREHERYSDAVPLAKGARRPPCPAHICNATIFGEVLR